MIGWGHGPLRDRGLLESALAAPLQSFDGQMFYPTVVEQAAVLLEHIVRNHPFMDGNKRTGWRACHLYLKTRRMVLEAEPGEAVTFIEDVATGALEHHQVTAWLAHHIRS